VRFVQHLSNVNTANKDKWIQQTERCRRRTVDPALFQAARFYACLHREWNMYTFRTWTEPFSKTRRLNKICKTAVKNMCIRRKSRGNYCWNENGKHAR